MEPVLLGMVAPVVEATGNALGRTAQAASKPFASLLRATANLMDRPGDEPTEATQHDDVVAHTPLTIQELRDSAQQTQTQLAQRIRELLEEAGISFDSSLRIGISEIDGSIELLSDHPQRALIETVLSRDADLAAEVHELVALQQLLALVDENEDLKSAFEENPLEVIAELRGRLDRQARIDLEVLPPSGAKSQFLG